MDYMKQYEKLNVDEICRICLLEKSEMSQIKDTCIENLLTPLPIQILEEDRSHFSCTDCLSELNKWNSFIEKLIKSFAIGHWLIQQKLKNLKQITQFDVQEVLYSGDPLESEKKPISISEDLLDTININESRIDLIKTENFDTDVDIKNIHNSDATENEIHIKMENDKDRVSNTNLEGHDEESNTKQKSKMYECPKCDKHFTRIQNLKDHMMRHYNSRNFACSICCKKFYKSFDVLEHMRTHTGERPFMCEFCTKTFTRAFILRNHIKKHHSNGSKLFVCEICDKVFANNYRLKIHVRIHTGEKPYRCTYCGTHFTMQSQLTSHIKYKHTKIKDYICNVCAKAFTARSTLEAHLRTHRGKKPEPRHQCSLCKKKCITTTQLKIHVKSIHTGESKMLRDIKKN